MTHRNRPAALRVLLGSGVGFRAVSRIRIFGERSGRVTDPTDTVAGMSTEQRALVLGGTSFVGRHLVDSLLRTGWTVTLFNRGTTNAGLFEGVARLQGDRRADTSVLATGEWDVVFDVNGYLPSEIDRAAEQLATRCEHYVYVSTMSVYESFATLGLTEDSPLAVRSEPVPEKVDNATYGPLKVLCEARVAALYPSHAIVRPTVIAGPHDPTDRFTYWPARLSESGPHLVPPSTDGPILYIDARDLADFTEHLGATRTAGVFNTAAEPLPFEDYLAAIIEVLGERGVTPDLVPLSADAVGADGIQPWSELPMWVDPSDATMVGFVRLHSAKAFAAGLTIRPLVDTIRDALAWFATIDRPLSTGLTAERERELLAERPAT